MVLTPPTLYVAWATKLSVAGHVIAEAKVDPYRVSMRRVAHKFSLAHPIYGPRMFPGQVVIEVRNRKGALIASHIAGGDSFYPKFAHIYRINPETINISTDDGYSLNLRTRDGEISWGG